MLNKSFWSTQLFYRYSFKTRKQVDTLIRYLRSRIADVIFHLSDLEMEQQHSHLSLKICFDFGIGNNVWHSSLWHDLLDFESKGLALGSLFYSSKP